MEWAKFWALSIAFLAVALGVAWLISLTGLPGRIGKPVWIGMYVVAILAPSLEMARSFYERRGRRAAEIWHRIGRILNALAMVVWLLHGSKLFG